VTSHPDGVCRSAALETVGVEHVKLAVEMDVDSQLLARLFALTDTPLTTTSLRNWWESEGYRHDASDRDRYGFWVHHQDNYPVNIDLVGDLLAFARVFIFGWDCCRPGEPGFDLKTYAHERSRFDDDYDSALNAMIDELGPPLLRWIEPNGETYRATIWQGQFGVGVLQQTRLKGMRSRFGWHR
jgi:hypothetical protein